MTNAEDAPLPLFQRALGSDWSRLADPVRSLHLVHSERRYRGRAEVTRGRGLLARLAAWFFGFPKAGRDVPLTLTKTRVGDGEIWQRDFDGRVFRSFCSPGSAPGRYKERFWWFTYEQDLPIQEGAMFLPVRRGWFLGLPLPRFLLPTSESKEYAIGDVFHFDVALGAPLGGGLIVRYRGSLAPVD